MDHGLEDLSHDQGDSHYQEMSADEAGGVNGTGSPSHAAGRLLLSSWHTGKKRNENFWTVFSKNLQLETAKGRCGTV